jgi:hypothetical protein
VKNRGDETSFTVGVMAGRAEKTRASPNRPRIDERSRVRLARPLARERCAKTGRR